ncbi:ATP-dependent RNA helicase HrpA [Buchananella hordeovulneris]|uniref:ATP-dependent RNA helicase HrpA n=1 Tax=Buchananella hordeovulneris TaxID=52770 RepID=UPI0026DD6CD1|nr:ATP-dependent RNA helicase HrpA [Buchananella hordeovulneris]MDO5080897.1 ATP-dependent RNA helicase HrpA [Buchananella hordeovulneris]
MHSSASAERSRRGQRRSPRPAARFTPAQVAARAAAVPAISYPPQLPVSARREEIMAALAAHQVVIVAGATGSGKTTQLPKMCLELGRGIKGLIGHTQPRRIAARSVAERLAFELDTEIGQTVGYQVRFTDEVGPNTLVKLMTDGILLAEVQRDPLLRRYDTIIVDEAHERSLNIDFILGYLARLAPQRPDLKIIITSATIDAQRFADHFSQFTAEPVPIIEVSGRTYPVEIRYRPLLPESADDAGETEETDSSTSLLPADPARLDGGEIAPAEEIDQVTGILGAVDELLAEGDGDILVFLAGERDIRDTHRALIDHLGSRYAPEGAARAVRPDAVEVLPLFARLTSAEQHRVFAPHSRQRIVLATNVAETSLTVPGIRYVIDPGLARISRFSHRTKVQRLPIEPVSRASADQRAGRCGRVADGVAIRLYSARDFASRPEFTEPEILRTSLASVILQMTALGLGRVEDFPFVDPPEKRAVRDGVALLTEIGALELDGAEPRLTKIGRRLASLPIDPRLARMLLAAAELGCAAEVLVIVAALSMQDVRERPAERAAEADAAHRRFTNPHSDFLTYVTLWRYIRTQQRELSGSAFRRMCRAEFLHYLRVREWQDLVTQLRSLARPLGLQLAPLPLPDTEDLVRAALEAGDLAGGAGTSSAVAAAVVQFAASARGGDPDAIHQALLTGLLSNIGSWDERRSEYAGPRGTRFVIWPGSGLAKAKKNPSWVMTAELVETSRLFARTVARIDPEWVEKLAGPLLARSYDAPHWSKRNGAAMINEKVMLYGLTLAAGRPVLLGRLGSALIGDVTAQELAREMFIRHALVEGQWHGRHAFVAENARRVAQAEEVERRSRTHGLVADVEARCAFFAARVPQDIVSARHFDAWWKTARRHDPDLLTYPPELLAPRGAGVEGFPDVWRQGEHELELRYEFTPGRHDDGVTVVIPVEVLPQVAAAGFDWMVPGLLDELVVATVRALPKAVRRELVPAPDVAAEVVAWLRQRGYGPAGAGFGGQALPAAADDDAAGPGRDQAGAAGAGTAAGDAPVSAGAAAAPSASGPAPAGDVPNSGEPGGRTGRLTLVPGNSMRDAWAALRAEAEAREAAKAAARRQAARAVDPEPTATDPSFRAAFTRAVQAVRGVSIPADAWQSATLPAHLTMTFRVVSGRGAVLGEGKDLAELQRELAPSARSAVRQVVRGALALAMEEATAQRAVDQARRGARGQGQQARPVDKQAGTRPGETPHAATQPHAAAPAGGAPAGDGQEEVVQATGLTRFPDAPLPRTVSRTVGGLTVRGYPALAAPAGGRAADVVVHPTQAAALAAHPHGLRAMLLAQIELPVARVTSRWSGAQALSLAASPYPHTEALVADAQWAAAGIVLDQWAQRSGVALDDVRDAEQFAQLMDFGRQALEDEVYRVLRWCAAAFDEARAVDKALAATKSLALLGVASGVREHVQGLLTPTFLRQVPVGQLVHLPRYLKGALRRLQRAESDPRADDQAAWVIDQLTEELAAARAAAAGDDARLACLEQVRWLIEELRVSLFAQQLGTPVKVSEKRVRAALVAC